MNNRHFKNKTTEIQKIVISGMQNDLKYLKVHTYIMATIEIWEYGIHCYDRNFKNKRKRVETLKTLQESTVIRSTDMLVNTKIQDYRHLKLDVF